MLGVLRRTIVKGWLYGGDGTHCCGCRRIGDLAMSRVAFCSLVVVVRTMRICYVKVEELDGRPC